MTKNLVLIEHEVMGPKLTQAEGFILGVGAKIFSCCGTRYLPASAVLLGIYRPRPLAQVASSATGGAPIAPHRRPGDPLRCIRQCGVWFHLLDNNFILTKRLDRLVKPHFCIIAGELPEYYPYPSLCNR